MSNEIPTTARRVKNVSREKRQRQSASRALRNGDWDNLASRVPTRVFRTAAFI